jgi:hypothetical protein
MAVDRDRPSIPARRLAKHLRYLCGREFRPARMVVYTRPYCANRSSVPSGHLWPHDIWSNEWPFEA